MSQHFVIEKLKTDIDEVAELFKNNCYYLSQEKAEQIPNIH